MGGDDPTRAIEGDDPTSAGGAGPATPGVPTRKVTTPRLTSLIRPRVIDLMAREGRGFRLVTGPAGSGKTTALVQLAESWPGPVVWLTADSSDRPPGRLARSLSASVRAGELPGPSSILEVVAAIDALAAPVLVVIDDAQELAGSPATVDLRTFGQYLPATALLALGARSAAGLDVWNLRTADPAVEIGPEDLRFRLWEVAELYRQIYQRQLSADELHPLAAVTDGWAAALHLYHVATRNSSVDHRLTMLGELRLRSRNIRSYLTEHVMKSIDASDRDALRRIAIFDRLRPAECDALLGRSSKSLLAGVARMGFGFEDGSDDSYRLHDLVRSHLLTDLAEDIGEMRVNDLYRRAASILVAAGRTDEAVRAYVRCADWRSASALLARGQPTFGMPDQWFENLPRHVQETDPWASRALGRRRLLDGDLHGARSGLRQARQLSAGPLDASFAAEIRLLDAWLDPPPGPASSWVARVRHQLAGRIPFEDSGPPEPGRILTQILTGRLSNVDMHIDQLEPTLRGPLRTVLLGARALSHLLAGRNPIPAADSAIIAARESGVPAVERLADGIVAACTDDGHDHGALVEACTRVGDELGAMLQNMIAGLGALRQGLDGRNDFRLAGAAFAAYDMAALSVMCDAFVVAQAPPHEVGSHDLDELERRSRSIGPLAHALCLLAQSRRHPGAARTANALRTAEVLAARSGFGAQLCNITDSWSRDAAKRVDPDPRAAIDVRCLGTFEVQIAGNQIDLRSIRPIHLQLLQSLALQPNVWVHRDELVERFWPGTDPERGYRNLQVGISSIRRCLEPENTRGGFRILVRAGERYRLDLGPDGSDLLRLETLIDRVETEARSHRWTEVVSLARHAHQAWNEVIPGSGAADWSVDSRRRLARRMSQMLLDTIEPAIATSDADGLVELLVQGLEIDPLNDRLWESAIRRARDRGSNLLAGELEDRYRALVA